MTTGGGFAHEGHLPYLADAAWVQAHKDSPDVVLVDIDVEAGYQRGHIPGAVMLPNNYERDPNTGWVSTLPPDKFATMCQSLGIGDETQVIVYDNNLSLYAARLWWVMTYYGHTNVRVLDGGWRNWVLENRPVSFDQATPNTRVRFTAKTNGSILGRLDEVRAACGQSDAVIWDVRTRGEYDGASIRGNRRAGHIPGAVHLEWSDLMDRETHRFKSQEEVRSILNEKGITQDEKGITQDKAVFAY